MAIFKCKICGGSLSINNNDTVAVCEYCGTAQTLPKLDDDKRVQLYDRANYFRRENEFDKAMGIYEMILSEDKEDYEAYWGIVLCRYGIQYVKDPKTSQRIPTVNRSQFTSIYDDEDFLNAIKYSDETQREIFKREAYIIDKIQKRILEISSKEEAFDVFICYKETDKNGNRTQDSVYAQDIYIALTKEGYKVFFSRITLEDKLGSAYEPYIFAALNSAKVMIVVGTEKDNFNAVWVKNEWSRFLSLIKAGKDKTLIPVYKDISPYDMPEEFAYLQSQDINKIGYLQDLVYGVNKLINKDRTAPIKETVVGNNANNNTVPLLERAFMFLEDGDWNSANEYCEKVLDIDPKNAQAYLGKLMAELRVKRQEELANCEQPFDKSNNYQKTIRFADDKLAITLKNCVEKIKQRNENDRKDNIYNEAIKKINSEDINELERAINQFKQIADWKDSQEKILLCVQRIEEIKIQEEQERIKRKKREEQERIEKTKKKKKTKRIAISVSSGIALFTAIVLLLVTVIIPRAKFKDIVAISAGTYHTLGVKSDGTVVAVGLNFNGQCDVDDWSDIVAVSAEGHTVGVKSDGTVVAIGENYSGECNVSGWTDIVAVSAESHTVGLKSNGTVVAVGLNGDGQCDVSDWTDIVAISAGGSHTVGLKSNGTVVAVGWNRCGECDVDEWNDIVAISAGGYHTIGLKSNGTVVAVGLNEDGQCDVSDWTDIVAISAGYAHIIGLKSDGSVVAVGNNDNGQCNVDHWSDIVAISAKGYKTVGLKSDGTVVTVGWNK